MMIKKYSEFIIENNNSKDINWVKPHFEEEEEEIMNHFLTWISEIYDIQNDEDYYQLITDIHYAYDNAKIEVLTDEEWAQMENTDSNDMKTEEDIYNTIGGYGRSKDRILKHSIEPLRNNSTIQTPIVAYVKDYPPYLVSGNTRLSACKVIGITPMVTKIII